MLISVLFPAIALAAPGGVGAVVVRWRMAVRSSRMHVSAGWGVRL
ncbi:hypothetical protein [Mycetocola zhujimingii]|nr:hypothetical protein [Mycetocola zhujimingii]